jgi:hypothetical protein
MLFIINTGVDKEARHVKRTELPSILSEKCSKFRKDHSTLKYIRLKYNGSYAVFAATVDVMMDQMALLRGLPYSSQLQVLVLLRFLGADKQIEANCRNMILSPHPPVEEDMETDPS